jgi:hypothetical protein
MRIDANSEESQTWYDPTRQPGARQPDSQGGPPVPPQEPDPQICPGCGTSNRGTAKFCRVCGAGLPAGAAPTSGDETFIDMPGVTPNADRAFDKTELALPPAIVPNTASGPTVDKTEMALPAVVVPDTAGTPIAPPPLAPPAQPGNPPAAGQSQRRILLFVGIGIVALLLVCVAAGGIALRFINGRTTGSGTPSSGGAATTASLSGIAARQTDSALQAATAAALQEATDAAPATPQNERATAEAHSQMTALAQAVGDAGAAAQLHAEQTATAQAATPIPPTDVPAPPTATPRPPTPAPTALSGRLRFTKLNENDEPGCISVQIRGISTRGWTFAMDGLRLSGRFDASGNARLCGLAPRQEGTLTVFNAQRQIVPGGRGIPTRGSAIMQASWG